MLHFKMLFCTAQYHQIYYANSKFVFYDALHDRPKCSTLYHDVRSVCAGGAGEEKKCFGPGGGGGWGTLKKVTGVHLSRPPRT